MGGRSQGQVARVGKLAALERASFHRHRVQPSLTLSVLLPPFPLVDMADLAVATTPEAHSADVEYFVRRGMTKGYQLLSLLTPPVYAVFAVTRYGRSHLSVNRILRATWMGGSLGAPILA